MANNRELKDEQLSKISGGSELILGEEVNLYEGGYYSFDAFLSTERAILKYISPEGNKQKFLKISMENKMIYTCTFVTDDLLSVHETTRPSWLPAEY